MPMSLWNIDKVSITDFQPCKKKKITQNIKCGDNNWSAYAKWLAYATAAGYGALLLREDKPGNNKETNSLLTSWPLGFMIVIPMG